MSLDFDARITARDFSVALTVDEGETVAIVGPNGAGKSTILALLAGLLSPDFGRATLDGFVLFDAGHSVPAHRRGVSLLAQEALLFPHLTVLDNVAFGPRSGGASRVEARAIAAHWLGEVDGVEFAGRRPERLSGGQAQRVAVARALASAPRLLLLDEPMAALDVTVVPAMRAMLNRVLAERTVIIVTHDVVDAYTLADRVIVLEGGRVVDVGATRAVLGQPRTAFAAAFVGLNLLPGGHGVVAPGAITVSTAPATPTPGVIVLGGTVLSSETRGDLVRVRSRLDGQRGELAADLTPLACAELAAIPGDRVWLAYPAADQGSAGRPSS